MLLAVWHRLQEESRTAFRDPIWVVCLVIIFSAAWFHFVQELSLVAGTSLYKYFVVLAALSPTCFAVVLLRLMGHSWRRALLLFLWAPLVFGVSALIYPYLGFFIRYFTGQCC